MKRLSVGVIFGGRSVEHDVSIVTAHQVMAALGPRHDVVPIYVTREGRWLTSPRLEDLDVYKTKRWDEVGEEAFLGPAGAGLQVKGGRLKGPKQVRLDVVIPAIHGTFGEDGTVQGLLELADIAYAGSGVTGSAVGMDKVAMKAVFRAAGIPVVRHVLVHAEQLAASPDAVYDAVEKEIGYPAFVKPSRLGSSVGIGKAKDRDGLRETLEVARRYDSRILVEESMEGCAEINCSVLGGYGHEPKVSVLEQPIPWEEFLSFSDKYMRGGKGGAKGTSKSQGMAAQERRIPAPLTDEVTKEVQTNALKAFSAIDAAGVARVDSFVREETGETWVMEINTIPGSFSFYLWEESGIPFSDLMDELLQIALDGHRAKADLMFTFDSGMLEGLGGPKGAGSAAPGGRDG